MLLVGLVVAGCSGDAAEPSAPDSATTQPPPSAEPADPLDVDTARGPVRGAESPVEGVRAFLAIPYAEAPVGELAWRPPQPRAPWREPFAATERGASCPQATDGVTSSFLTTPEPDPDCLTLDVWSPEGADGLPVMVWIHGGGFGQGSAHMPYYDGDDLAAEGVVVVSMNYRLGPFGFLALEVPGGELMANHGLLDQRLALEWVQDNAAAFGGDPDNVTVFGESAGGFSVCGHLAASRDLFDKAIIQSGGGCDQLRNPQDALAHTRRYLDGVGCADVACLRDRSTDELLAVGFDPAMVADGTLLERPARQLAADGELDDVPLLVGSNADEATLFSLGLAEPSDEELQGRADGLGGDALLEAYPAEAFESNLERFRALLSDVAFICPTLDLASVVPGSFVYHYTYVAPDTPFRLGATHGAEIASVFGHPEGIDLGIERTDETEALSDAVQAAWTAFAGTGHPGEAFTPYAENGQVTLIDVPFRQVDEIRDGRCETVNRVRRGR